MFMAALRSSEDWQLVMAHTDIKQLEESEKQELG